MSEQPEGTESPGITDRDLDRWEPDGTRRPGDPLGGDK